MNRRQIASIIGGNRRGETPNATASRLRVPKSAVAEVLRLAERETADGARMRASLQAAKEAETLEVAKASAKRILSEPLKREARSWPHKI